MADCELNYLRLLGLCPALDAVDMHSFVLDDRRQRRFIIRVLERFRYTIELEIAEQAPSQAAWLGLPVMRVRLYQDARLAEVVGFHGVSRVHPRYPYPNRVMHQPDEKAQWNRFLAEWLSIVADTGYAVSEPFVAID